MTGETVFRAAEIEGLHPNFGVMLSRWRRVRLHLGFLVLNTAKGATTISRAVLSFELKQPTAGAAIADLPSPSHLWAPALEYAGEKKIEPIAALTLSSPSSCTLGRQSHHAVISRCHQTWHKCSCSLAFVKQVKARSGKGTRRPLKNNRQPDDQYQRFSTIALCRMTGTRLWELMAQWEGPFRSNMASLYDIISCSYALCV